MALQPHSQKATLIRWGSTRLSLLAGANCTLSFFGVIGYAKGPCGGSVRTDEVSQTGVCVCSHSLAGCGQDCCLKGGTSCFYKSHWALTGLRAYQVGGRGVNFEKLLWELQMTPQPPFHTQHSTTPML